MRPESGAAPTLMLEYQKSRRRRTALGLDGGVGVRSVESNTSLTLTRLRAEKLTIADDFGQPGVGSELWQTERRVLPQ
jgi:hypothetical protein